MTQKAPYGISGKNREVRFSRSPGKATFPEIFHGLVFRSVLWKCIQNLRFKFCIHFHRTDRNTSPLKISGKCSCGHSQGLLKVFVAHRTVTFAIARLSCYQMASLSVVEIEILECTHWTLNIFVATVVEWCVRCSEVWEGQQLRVRRVQNARKHILFLHFCPRSLTMI